MRFTLVIGLSLLGVGCASYAPPNQHLASSMAAVRGAQVAGAQQVPEAALHLRLAEEQINQAKNMIENGENERADYMTVRAYNDAALAMAIAREEAARQRAQQFAELARHAAEQARVAQTPTP